MASSSFYIVERFGDVVVRTEVHSFSEILFFCFCSKKYKRDGSGRRVLVQYAQYAKAVELRHHNIAEDEVRLIGSGFLYAYFSVFRSSHIIA